MTETVKRRQNTKMVPAPSHGIIPERDQIGRAQSELQSR